MKGALAFSSHLVMENWRCHTTGPAHRRRNMGNLIQSRIATSQHGHHRPAGDPGGLPCPLVVSSSRLHAHHLAAAPHLQRPGHAAFQVKKKTKKKQRLQSAGKMRWKRLHRRSASRVGQDSQVSPMAETAKRHKHRVSSLSRRCASAGPRSVNMVTIVGMLLALVGGSPGS